MLRRHSVAWLVARLLAAFLGLPAVAAGVVAPPAGAHDGHTASEGGDAGPVRSIVFPVVGDVHYTDTYGAPRSGGRTHAGQDLMGPKMLELVAAEDGTVTYLNPGGRLSGGMLEITSDDGWVYSYLHLNNDTPGTDDGQATYEQMFAPGIERGVRVVAGQLVGYLGDSGNAEETPPHLHFEMKAPTGEKVNPMASLDGAQRLDAPVGAQPSPIPRLAGPDRVATAVAVSEAGWPDGAVDVVLAQGDRYAEALPASVLAAARNGPLLLTTGTELSASVAAELDRLAAQRVTVVGSVPDAVASAVAATGRAVERVGVPGDPATTAVAVARAVGGAAGTVVLVNRDRFADGVSASAIAAGRGWPVLLSSETYVPQVTVDAWRELGVRRVVLVGGTAVVGGNVEAFVRDRGRCAGGTGCEVERLAGGDRYATSAVVVRRSLGLGDRSAASVLVGTGTTYPDALASGPLASRLGGVAVLVDGSGSGGDGATRSLLAELAADVRQVSILGGRGAVTAAADLAVQRALGLS